MDANEIRKEEFKRGSFIFVEGDEGTHFYIVEKGKVKIFKKNKAGDHAEVASITEGESFGEFAMLDKKPRSATAQAVEDCIVVRVSEKGYQKLLSELPVWASSMLMSFAERIKNMNEKV